MWIWANIGSTGMFLAGVVLLMFLLLRRTYRYYGRRRPARRAAEDYLVKNPRPPSQRRSLSAAPAEILAWHVELHDTARELKAELDSKMRVLQLLIGQARHEALRLEKLHARLEGAGAETSVSIADSAASAPIRRTSWIPGSPDQQAEIFQLADAGCSPDDIAKRLGTPLGEVELLLSLRSATHGS